MEAEVAARQRALAERALPKGAVAAACRWLVMHPRFEAGILCCIFTNCVLLSFDDPSPDAAPMAPSVMALDTALALIYLLEASRGGVRGST